MTATVPKQNLNQWGRDKYCSSERDRGARGFTKLNHAEFWPDVPRLCNGGAVQVLLLLWCFRMRGAPGKGGVRTPGWTPWVRWEELAGRLGCSVRTLQEDVADLDIPSAKRAANATGKGRGVLEAEDRRGEVRFKLLTDLWESLPDYQPGRPVVVEPPKVEEPKQPVPLVKNPVRVRGDKPSRSVAVKFHLKKIRCQAVGFNGGFNFGGSFNPVDGILTLDILNPASVRAGRVPAKARKDNYGAKAKAKLATTDSEPSSSPTKINQPVTDSIRRQTADSFASDSPEDLARKYTPPPSPPCFSSLAAALRVHGPSDDAMARKVMRDCRGLAPECTEDQVIEAVDFVGSTLSENVRFPIAVIRSQVPNLFSTGKLLLPKKKEPKMSERDRKVFETMDLLEGRGKWAKK